MDVAAPDRVTAALERIAVWPPDLAPDARYVPLAELDVAAYSEAICHRLGGAPLRVGQSALLMGVASRLWSLTVVPAARDGILPDPAGFTVRQDAGAVVLGVAEVRGFLAPTADDVHELALGVLRPLVDALPLSERLLWGNAAASLCAVPRVHDLPEAVALVGDLVHRSPYAGELDLLGDGRARRRTCCLFYEVPGAGLCGDCVFDHAPSPSTWAPSQG
jgi:hypothetical protein